MSSDNIIPIGFSSRKADKTDSKTRAELLSKVYTLKSKKRESGKAASNRKATSSRRATVSSVGVIRFPFLEEVKNLDVPDGPYYL